MNDAERSERAGPRTGYDTGPAPEPVSEHTSGQARVGTWTPDGEKLPLPTEDDLIAATATVYDPEIPVNIYELGLIYKVDINDDRHVDVEMTLTAPGCPVAGEMPGWVEAAAKRVEGVNSVNVNLVFDPPWTPARMSDEAKLELNML